MPLATESRMRQQLVLALYWFGISFLWGSFLSLIVPSILVPAAGHGSPLIDPATKNTATALLESFGLVVALLVQPASGAISDRLHTRWGRRRPLIAVGALAGVVALLIAAGALNYWMLLFATCVLQVGMNISQGAYQGLMPDTVSTEHRGEASGFLGIATMLGQVLGFLPFFFLPARAVCLVIAAVVGITAAWTVLRIPEKDAEIKVVVGGAKGDWLAHLRGYLKEFASYPDFCWVVAARFASFTGLACMQKFARNYLFDNFHSYSVFGVNLGNPDTATAAVFMGVIVFGAFATYPAVKLSDRIGRKNVIVGASIIGSIGMLLFFLASSLTEIVLVAIPIGVAFGMMVSVDWAYMADLAPKARAGKFMGFSNIATAGSQAFAPALLGPAIDVLKRSKGAWIAYHMMFAVAAGFFILGAILLLTKVKRERIAEADQGLAAS